MGKHLKSKEKGKPQKVHQKFQCCRSPITVVIVSILAIIGFAAAATTGILLFLKEDKVIREVQELKSQQQNPKNNTDNINNVINNTITSNDEQEICNTPDCLTLAYQLNNWRDPKTDPCDDFFQYACGRFVEYSNGPGPVSDKFHNIVRLTKKFVSTTDPTRSYTYSEQAMRKLYEKCEKEAPNGFIQAQKDAFAYIKKEVKFPWMDPNWTPTNLDVHNALLLMAKYGVKNFGLFSIDLDETANSKGLQIHPPYFQQPNLPNTFANVKSILYQNGVNIPQAEMQAASDLRDELSGLDNYVGSENKKTVDELDAAHSEISFRNILDDAYVKDNKFLEGQQVLLFLDKITVSNAELFFGPNKKRITQNMPRPALRHFVRNHFNRENRNAMSELVEDIRASYIDIFKKNTWMEKSTRKSAIEKAEKMTRVIGYGDEYEPEGTLDKMYEEFVVNIDDNESYFSMIVKLNHLHVRHFTAYVYSDSHFNIWFESFAVNAWYFFGTNKFIMLIPFFDKPFFDASFPKFAQLAGIGRIVGHEIGHAYDSNGRKYDKNGEKIDWWTSGDAQNYARKEQCVIDQYSNYEDPDYGKMDGDYTKGENIADLISAQVLWNAYKKLDPSKQPKLSGLNDTDKLFFQIGALTWCEHRDNPAAIRDHILNDIHGVSRFRVNGVYQNMPEFSETFNCPKGSPMNPADKCEMFF